MWLPIKTNKKRKQNLKYSPALKTTIIQQEVCFWLLLKFSFLNESPYHWRFSSKTREKPIDWSDPLHTKYPSEQFALGWGRSNKFRGQQTSLVPKICRIHFWSSSPSCTQFFATFIREEAHCYMRSRSHLKFRGLRCSKKSSLLTLSI